MCLITRQKEPIILTEDLIVYKTLKQNLENEDLESLYFCTPRFHYNRGELYKTNILESVGEVRVFDNDVSSKYGIPNNGSDDMREILKAKNLFAYGQGFHFLTDCTRLDSYFLIAFECTIPAGSKVYYDETGLGVADQIIINEKR